MTDVLEKLCEVDVCFTNRLEETACKTGIDHRHFLECIHSVLSVTFLSLLHTHTHEYANYFHILVSLLYVFAKLANTCTCDL